MSADTEPTPVRCPAPAVPVMVAADPAELDPLLARLVDPAPVPVAEVFPRGTLQPDGRLDLCKQSLGAVGAIRVIPVAARSPHVAHLLLGTNTLGATGAVALAEALADEHNLRTLYLGCNHIDTDGIKPLADRLADDSTVQALWIKRNPIGDQGVAALARALRGNSTLRTLDLTNTGLTVDGLRVLTDALCQRETPTSRLYVGGNNLGPDAAMLLAALLRDAGVNELYLAAGQLGDAGARVLAEVVQSLPGRRIVLSLGGNGVGEDGVRALAAALPALAELDLARPPSARLLRAVPNEVGDAGAAALAETLAHSGLRRLDLRHTGVRGRGAKALLAAVQRDTDSDLEELGLGLGVPRRVKRDIGVRLRPRSAPPAEIRAIMSVYR